VTHIKRGNKQLNKLEDRSMLVVLLGMSQDPRRGGFIIQSQEGFMSREMQSLKTTYHEAGIKPRSVMMSRSPWSMSLLVACKEQGESGMVCSRVLHKLYPCLIKIKTKCTLLLHL
jgi:hypothetical protein